MPWIFGSFLVTPFALTRCLVVTNKQGHVMRTTRSDLDRVQRIIVERGTRSRSGRLKKACEGCKRWRPLAPGRRYGKKKSSL